jgi:transcription elongation GreA/GreB family factor
MSRAFVKETDDVPELPDRPLSPHPNFVTPRGLKLIEAEVARHTRALGEAREAGEREKIAAAARELRYWTARRASADVQPPPADCAAVRFGAQVTIRRDDGRTQTYRIVGEDEADARAGLLSYLAPLAQALMSREVGDVVEVSGGEVEVVKIEG